VWLFETFLSVGFFPCPFFFSLYFCCYQHFPYFPDFGVESLLNFFFFNPGPTFPWSEFPYSRSTTTFGLIQPPLTFPNPPFGRLFFPPRAVFPLPHPPSFGPHSFPPATILFPATFPLSSRIKALMVVRIY